VIAIAAAISPTAVRDEVRARIPNFVEIYVECPLSVDEPTFKPLQACSPGEIAIHRH